MEPDNPEAWPVDRIERAHLRDPSDDTHVIHRYPVPADLGDLAQRFWIPVWSVPAGREAPQHVLQYPVGLIVVSTGYARFYGVSSGLSTTVLAGDGWAVGIMLQPAGGSLVSGGPMDRWTDRHGDLADVLGEAGAELTEQVRAAMTGDPGAEASHRAAMGACSGLLRRSLPVDPEGLVVNELVAFVEASPEVTRVAQVCAELGMSERTLQRLCRRRLGLTPKWLIQRRRLHEAVERLRQGQGTLAGVAAELGYADQPHLTRDLQAVTGMTPGELAARYR
jgi:AraC-like DNA-binding protein